MLKKILIDTAGVLGAWSLTRRLTRHAPRIFMLHRFSEYPHPRCIDAKYFGQFIDRVSRECELLSFRDLIERIDEGLPVRRPLAAITVDDGYEDFYTVALPILAQQRVPATLFATAGFVDGQCWLWWDALRYLIDEHPSGSLLLHLPERDFDLKVGDASSRHKAWLEIAGHLATRNSARKITLLKLEESAQRQLPEKPTSCYAPMNWDQLARAEAAGIEIGGHTMTHAFLPSLDAAGLRHELYDAKELLGRNLTRPVTTFAYPNGAPEDYPPSVVRAVSAAGFSAAVVAHPRPFSASDRFRIGRWSVGPANPQLSNILNGASLLQLDLMHHLRMRFSPDNALGEHR